jgi:type II secretory pathway pseudopilin PulG
VFDPRKAKTSKFPIRPSHVGTIALVLLLVVGGIELYRYQQGRAAAEQQKQEEEKKKEADQVLQTLGNAGKNTGTHTEGTTTVDTAPAAGNTSEVAAIRSAPAGELMLSSTPPGARVDIDGKHEVSWVTPRTIRKVAPGPHTLVFSKSGFKSETRIVEVQNRKTVYVNANLTPGS